MESIETQQLTGAVFLDFKKAFDLVNHDILLKKLSLYLQNDDSLNFFTSYLSSRLQFVSINYKTASLGNVTCGVPQGSILGPLLFCIYINDLPLAISDKSVRGDLFADDSTLHTKGKSIFEIESSLQNAVNDVELWAVNNKMILHPDKSKSMKFLLL